MAIITRKSHRPVDVDVAIIGGGPGGCGAALTLCAKGHSVAAIDPGISRSKPTETAPPALQRHLELLGAAEALSACEPCFGIASTWGRSTPEFQSGVPDPFGHSWFIHRGPFDRCLKLTSLSMGAIWIEGRAQRINFDERSVSIETTIHVCVRAKWLIFATGSPAWPAKVTQQDYRTIDPLIAYWASLPARLEERMLLVEADENGWWYACPGGSDDSVACFVTDAASSRSLGISKPDNWNRLFQGTALFRWLGDRAVATSTCVVSSGLAALPRSTGARWIAVGDAAAKLDPLGGAGILSALGSARRGACAVSRALRGDADALSTYAKSVGSLVSEFVSQREQQYAIEARRRAGAFWTARLQRSRALSPAAVPEPA